MEHTSTVIFMICTIINCYAQVSIMSGKGTICADEEPKDEKKRNVMSLSQTARMLNRLDKGMTTEAVGSHHGVNINRFLFFIKTYGGNMRKDYNKCYSELKKILSKLL